MPLKLNLAHHPLDTFGVVTGAALLGADARLLSQEYRRVLAPYDSQSSAAPLRLGFRELLYFQVVSALRAEGLQLSPVQKRQVFRVLTEKTQRLPVDSPPGQVALGEWSRGHGELRKTGAVTFRPSARGSLCFGAPEFQLPWSWSSCASASAAPTWRPTFPSSAGRPSTTPRSRPVCRSLQVVPANLSPCSAAEDRSFEAVDRRKPQPSSRPLGL